MEKGIFVLEIQALDIKGYQRNLLVSLRSSWKDNPKRVLPALNQDL